MGDELLRAVHGNSSAAVELALRSLKAADSRARVQEALLRAVWLNNAQIVEKLLEEGASPDAKDEESGWCGLHRAFFWGHLHVAALLLDAGAQLHTQDDQGRSPLDLLSKEQKRHLAAAAPEGEVYTWGNGANYQLGSGATGLQLAPVRLEALREVSVETVSAAKFHSAAISHDGRLYTWGFGRGGRLGHADSDIHSGQSAAILPQQLAFFSRRQVVRVSAAKHHTAAITSAGELFTWGSNRDGRLGYPSVDTQPTPRKITTFNRQRVIEVAAANRHTVALLEGGAVFSWGCNQQGQLGYGTTDSSSNAVPRVVEALKGKNIKAVAAAKRHTLVLTRDGEVFTWGHQVVTPKRVQLSGGRDVARANAQATSSGGWKVVFHNGQSSVSRPEAVMIAAGAAHSSAVTSDGVVLTWRSMDPALRPQEVSGPLAGAKIVSISAGKYRTAAVTADGNVFMWEGWSKATEAVPKRPSNHSMPGTSPPEGTPPDWEIPRALRQRNPGKANALAFQLILPQRIEGLKRITEVAVGEKHSIARQSWSSAPSLGDCPCPASAPESTLSPRGSEASALEDADCLPRPLSPHRVQSGAYWDKLEQTVDAGDSRPSSADRRLRGGSVQRGCASMQRLCERRVAHSIVEPRTVLQVLQYADAAGAQVLRKHCMQVAIANLDLVVLESRTSFEQLPPHILEEIGQQWRSLYPRALAAPATLRDGDSADESPKAAETSPRLGASQASSTERAFWNPKEEAEAADRARQERTIRKKLQQIEVLQHRAGERPLDSQQLAKLAMQPTLTAALQALQSKQPLEVVRRMLAQPPPPAATKGAASDKEISLGGVLRQRSRRQRGGGSDPAQELRSSTPPNTCPKETSPFGSGPIPGLRSQGGQAPAVVEAARPEAAVRVAGFQDASSSRSFTEGGKAGQFSPDEGHNFGKVAGFVKKPAKRKGGLSMFLAGHLEQPETKPVTPPAAQKPPPLTWAHAAQASPAPLSLRDILDEEAAQSSVQAGSGHQKRASSEGTLRPASKSPVAQLRGLPPSRSITPAAPTARASDDGGSPSGGITIALGDLVRKSRPIAVAKQPTPERSGPAWRILPGGSPQAGATRLQDIQAEQEHARESLSRSWGTSGMSPGSHRGVQPSSNTMSWRAPGAAFGTSPGASFPAGTSPGSSTSRRSLAPSAPPQNKWYIKEEQEIIPLRSIQTEESAIKELSALYGAANVRLAPKQKTARG